MSQNLIHPYLFLGGHCEEALEFYHQAVGAEVKMMMRYKESPEPPPPDQAGPEMAEKIMHSEFLIGGSTVMASDGCGDEIPVSGFSLFLSTSTEAEAHRLFNALAEGGKVGLPLTKTFWSPAFGMLTDKFGVGWMIGVAVAQ